VPVVYVLGVTTAVVSVEPVGRIGATAVADAVEEFDDVTVELGSVVVVVEVEVTIQEVEEPQTAEDEQQPPPRLEGQVL
jgi:hypothetical protein